MKKVSALIFVLTLMLAPSLFAADVAIKSGTFEFGIGDLISFSNISADDWNYNLFSIGTFGNRAHSPWLFLAAPIPTLNWDYFIINNLGIGLLGGYASIKEEDADEADSLWLVGPEVKYYIGIMDNVQLDAHASIVFMGSSYWDPATDETSDYSQTKLTLGLALNYFIGNNFAIALGLDYTRFFEGKADGDEVDTDIVTSAQAANAVTVNLGLKAFLGLL